MDDATWTETVRQNYGGDLTWVGLLPIDAAHFPDPLFRIWVEDNADWESDGWLSTDELESVDSLISEDAGYTSLDGVGFFTELTMLSLGSCPYLETIDLSRNTQLVSLSLTDTGLTELSLNGLTALQELCLKRSSITELDVSGCTSLVSLDCRGNALTALTLGEHDVLARLDCRENALTELDLIGCPLLAEAVINGEMTEGAGYVEYKTDETHYLRADSTTELIPEDMTVIIHSASVVLDGLIRIKYYYTGPVTLLRQDGAAIVFYSDGVEVKRTPLSEGVLVTTGTHTGEYAYYFEVVAKEIRSQVTTKIVDGNCELVTVKSASGTDYTDGFTYSVQTYAQNKQSSTDEKLRALAKAIEDYGIAAKIYFGYGDTSGLAVSEAVQAVTEADLLPYALSTEGTKPAGFTGCTITVMCEADSSLRIYFKFDGTKAPESYTYTVDGNPAELSERSDGAKYLVVRNIAAKNLGDMHTFSITDGTDTYTVTASALSYALTSVRNGNAARQNLGKALYVYYLAAKNYFG